MYNTKELEEKSIDLIEKYKLMFIEDLVAYLGISKKTFYNYKLHELHEIKEKFAENKVAMKITMRNKWYKSDNPTLQLALMKLISSDEERRKLAMEYRDHTSKGERIGGGIDVNKLSTKKRKQLQAIIENEE